MGPGRPRARGGSLFPLREAAPTRSPEVLAGMGNAFVIENQNPTAGPLPQWAVERPQGSYFGYFQNEFGDQWVLVAFEGRIRLAGGPEGWGNVRQFWPTEEDRLLMEESPGGVTWPEDLVMNRDERLWLMGCLASCVPGLLNCESPA